MTEDSFWSIIEASREVAEGDQERQTLELRQKLENLDPNEIVEFDEHFKRLVRAGYRFDLWDAAMIVAGGTCSDDSFWDFREWLVSQGAKIYSAAMSDPDSLAEVVDRDDPNRSWLSFENPAIAVWGEKLGKNDFHTYRDFPGTLGSSLGEIPEGAPCGDERKFAERFPKLWQKFFGNT